MCQTRDNGGMWRRIGVVTLWALATIGTASITLAAVGQVGDSVTQQAATPIDAADLLASPAVQALSSTTTTTAAPTTTAVTTTVAEATTTTGDTTSTTAGGGSVTTAPGTTSPVASSTTTTSVATAQLVVRDLVGGRVSVWFDGATVVHASSQASSGGGPWTVEVKDSGPNQVVVEFESASHESTYHAEVEGGQLVIEIEEGDHD